MSPSNEIRVTRLEMENIFRNVLLKHCFSESKAIECTGIFTHNNSNGISIHEVNKFSRFIQIVVEETVQPDKDPFKTSSFAGMEQWNGNLDQGPLNGVFCTKRTLQPAN